MYSTKENTVLDPFLGTGTTMAAAMTAARHFIGFEIDSSLKETIRRIPEQIVPFSNEYIENRLRRHVEFVENRVAEGKPFKHRNTPFGFPVVTAQEKDLSLEPLLSAKTVEPDVFEVEYEDAPFVLENAEAFKAIETSPKKAPGEKKKKRCVSFRLFEGLRFLYLENAQA